MEKGEEEEGVRRYRAALRGREDALSCRREAAILAGGIAVKGLLSRQRLAALLQLFDAE